MARGVGLNREQVVATAAKLADEVGLDQLTLAQVATALGVRLPSLYNHVAGLNGLRRELTLLGLAQLRELFYRAAIGKSGEEALLALGYAYRSFILEHPALTAATVVAALPDDIEVNRAAKEVVDILIAVLLPLYGDETTAIYATRAFRSAVYGFAIIEASGGFGIPISTDESFTWLLHNIAAAAQATKLE